MKSAKEEGWKVCYGHWRMMPPEKMAYKNWCKYCVEELKEKGERLPNE